MNPKSFHVCKLLISMATWDNRLMFYTMYMHQNINLLLNKGANLGLYDQTCATVGWWQRDLFTHEKHQRFREIWAAPLSDGYSNLLGIQSTSSPKWPLQVSSATAHPPQFAFKTLPLNTLLHTAHGGYFHFSTWSLQGWLSVQDFPNKIMTYPCHVVSRCGNHRPCHSNPCVNEEC